MPLGRKTAFLAAVIVAFTAAALAIVWLVTEPGGGRPATAAQGAGADRDWHSEATPDVPRPPPEAGIAAPPEWRSAHPTVAVPVANEAPAIAAPPPAGLPTDAAEREDAILAARRSRFAGQMERLNRRTADRGGVPGDAGARPPSKAPPGPGASRRSVLSEPD